MLSHRKSGLKKLRVEALEGREMLSANPVSAAFVALPIGSPISAGGDSAAKSVSLICIENGTSKAISFTFKWVGGGTKLEKVKPGKFLYFESLKEATAKVTFDAGMQKKSVILQSEKWIPKGTPTFADGKGYEFEGKGTNLSLDSV